MPPRESKRQARGNSEFKSDDNNDEQKKPSSSGNSRGGYRKAYRSNHSGNEETDNVQKSRGHTKRGSYISRHEESATYEGVSKPQRVKPYKPGSIKKQKSEIDTNFQVVAREDNEEYTQKRAPKQSYKKPNPKDLVWERPHDRDEKEITKDKPNNHSTENASQDKFKKQIFKKSYKKDISERTVDNNQSYNSEHVNRKKPTFTNFQIIAQEDNNEEYTQKKAPKQSYKKPNPKDLVWERPHDRDEKEIAKQSYKKPNPKDLVWERPHDRDEKEITKDKNHSTANASQDKFKKQTFKKPNPKDLVWERPHDRDEKEIAKQSYKKPNPKDLVWERTNDKDYEGENDNGIHKYLDGLSQGPNIFTLPQGFSGFGSYRDSDLPLNVFETRKLIIVNNQDDQEESFNQDDKEEREYKVYVDDDIEEDHEKNEDIHDEEDEDQDYSNFTIERKSSDDEKENEKQQPIELPPKTYEKSEKNMIYSKLKTIESKTKIWEKSYPFKANSIIGTCQDKCPKLEITNREKDNDLSLFEKTGKVIIDEHGIKIHKADPNACVKKYARSAAAVQPDPSLIRPPLVLKKTLEYLTNNILERKEEYHTKYFFIRDRARSIVQDLTIQDIRDERSVDLHEIISRFHIMSHHLLADVGEELSDPHQNLELMSKWLKSLQELYSELRSNGIECPNESEFTAYYILVKITSDQEVAKCLRNLPSKVSKSPEVLFALKVYGAFSTKNYVRFFGLVKEASYLSACLMHMYFTHVREEALRIMNTAFNIKVTDISKAGRYPISKLVDILAFETERECKDFCRAHGIFIDTDDLLFKYTTFVTPDKKIKSKRSFKLIEAKVVGIPYSDLVNLNFRIAPETSKTPPKASETNDNEPLKKPEIINQLQKEPSISQPTQIVLTPEQQHPPTIDISTKDIITIEQPIKIPPFTFKIQSPVQPNPNLRTLEQSIPVFKLPPQNQPIPPVNGSTTKPLNIPTVTQPRPPIPFKIPTIPVNQIPIEPIIPSLQMPQIPISPIKPLGPSDEEIKKELKSKYFSVLKNYAYKKKKLRESRKQHFSNSMEFVLQENTLDNFEEQSMCKFYKHIFRKRFLNQLYQPLDLASIIFNSSVTDKHYTFSSFFWKLMIITGKNSFHLNEWLESKFFHSNSDDYLCNFSVSGKDVDSLPRTKKNTELHICARTPGDTRSWRGVSSIIFILDDPNNIDLQTYITLEKNKMHQHFSNLDSFQDLKIPILILYDRSWFHKAKEDILKETLLRSVGEDFKYFSHMECTGIDLENLLNFPSIEEITIVNQVLENFTFWLANHSSGPPLLHTFSIRDLIEETTYSHIRSLLKDIDTREYSITVKDLILIYNDVCESLSHQIINESERMRKLNWPAPEFEKYTDWNTDENSILQKEVLGQLSLPTIDLNLYNSKHIVDDLCNTCKQYVTNLFSKRKVYNPIFSEQSIKWLILDLVNGGGCTINIKIFEMFLEIHLNLIFDRDPLYTIVFTTSEFKTITNSVLERLRYTNPFIKPLRGSRAKTPLSRKPRVSIEHKNLKRTTKEEHAQEKDHDCKKRKVVAYVDTNHCLSLYSQLSNKILEQKTLYSHLESSTPHIINYVEDIDMTNISTTNTYQSCIDSLKLLQEKLEISRNII